MLKRVGYKIQTAATGAEAIRAVKEKKPDLILLDILLPDFDGYDVLQRIRKFPDRDSIPVIFMTALRKTDEKVKGFELGAVDYITKPFVAAEVLARVNTHITLRRLQFAQEVNIRKLTELNEEKNDFIGMIAHDLKNPLHVINGFAKIVTERLTKTSPDILYGYLEIIERTSAEMRRAVGELLDINAIESGQIMRTDEPFQVEELIAEVVRFHSEKAGIKGIAIEEKVIAGTGVIYSNRSVFMHTLHNLLSNAIKFSPACKSVCLKITVAADSLYGEVQDEGPGLTGKDQKRLFKKFAKLSAIPTGGEGSTGLGLYNVRKLIDNVNGEISVESKRGKGAKFTFRIPCRSGEN